MHKKDLHLVFGFSGETILSQSQIINKDEGDMLSFCDLVALGPLCNLDDLTGIEKRKSWFRRFLYSIESEEGSNVVDHDFIQIQTLVNTVENYKRLYLWLGNNANEQITTARVLHQLQECSIPIFKLNFAEAKFKNDKGHLIAIGSLQEMKQTDLPELMNHFETLSEQNKQSFGTLWKQLLVNQADIHLFDKENKCISGSESWFDPYLLNRCIATTKSSLVVAYTLYDIWAEWGLGEVGDIFLFYRLNVLEKEGKVNITNRDKDPERGRRLFNVTCVS